MIRELQLHTIMGPGQMTPPLSQAERTHDLLRPLHWVEKYFVASCSDLVLAVRRPGLMSQEVTITPISNAARALAA